VGTESEYPFVRPIFSRRAGRARGGEESDLDADDQKTVEEWLDQRPAPTKPRVQDLAATRLTRVEGLLKEKHGIDAQRIVRRAPVPAPAGATQEAQGDSPPTVEIETRVGGRPGAPRVDVVIDLVTTVCGPRPESMAR
jgi:hypothetical protein